MRGPPPRSVCLASSKICRPESLSDLAQYALGIITPPYWLNGENPNYVVAARLTARVFNGNGNREAIFLGHVIIYLLWGFEPYDDRSCLGIPIFFPRNRNHSGLLARRQQVSFPGTSMGESDLESIYLCHATPTLFPGALKRGR